MRLFLILLIIGSTYANDKVSGLIYGSLLGDALGGPFEFVNSGQFNGSLEDYSTKATAFGAWKDNAEAGSITDDSRHKLIFIDFLTRTSNWNEKLLANTYVFEFNKVDNYSSLRKEWLREYITVAISLSNGLREKPRGAIWSGLATVSGQLVLIPLSTPYRGDPESAYLKCWELNWFDSGTAMDMNCAIVGGLSYLLEAGATWEGFLEVLTSNDPYGFKETPFIGRPLNHWIKKSLQIARTARSVNELKFNILKNVPAYYWWEDYAVITTTISYLEYFKERPDEVLLYLIRFGKDTDTYAQLAGAILGAWKGKAFFQDKDLETVERVLKDQYMYNLDQMINDLENVIPEAVQWDHEQHTRDR